MTRTRNNLAVLWALAAIVVVTGAHAAEYEYQAHYLYLNEDPSNSDAGWDDAPRGLAHDATHWFITDSHHVWRAPVSLHLAEVYAGVPGVVSRDIHDIPELWDLAFTVFGDPCVYRYLETDYLLVPVYGSGIAALAAFRGENLEFLDMMPFPSNSQGDFGGRWCAVDDGGMLYSSQTFTPVLGVQRFTVDWELLNSSGVLSFGQDVGIPLLDESGNLSADHLVLISGEISTGGALLYMITRDGGAYHIEVFELPGGRRVQKSTPAFGHFQFIVGPDYTYATGLAIWDLEGTGSPHRGELHVVIEDVDEFSGPEVGVKHYSRLIRVDSATIFTNGNGTPWLPFRTIGSAVNLAWDGAEIRARAGSYPESLSISKRVRMTAEGGVVRIGD